MEDKCFELVGVSRSFGDLKAVDGLTLSLGRGEVTGFLGTNGAGKTTTIKMLIGLIRPTTGTVRLFGGDPTKASSRARIGYMPEMAYYYPYLNVRELLAFYGGVCGMDRRTIQARTEELLKDVELEEAAKRPLKTYSKGMRYFLVFTLLAFLAVMAYMNVLRYIISPGYWAGLRVVPIVMAAEIMMGVYFNLSFWYKLTDKTLWGAVFSGVGCAVLIAVNLIFVPRYGYIACAWGGFAGYGSAMVLSYLVGQKYMKIDYKLLQLLLYVAITAVLFVAVQWSNAHLGFVAALAVNTALLLLFAAYIVMKELRPLVIKVLRRFS